MAVAIALRVCRSSATRRRTTDVHLPLRRAHGDRGVVRNHQEVLPMKARSLLAVAATIVAVAAALPAVAAARHGADDARTELRHARGADDTRDHVRRARAADDVRAELRHARGADDGPNHG
jgi:hypothetical protein